MTRLIGYALLLLAFVMLAVWGFGQFVRPVLPPNISAWLVPIAAAFTGAAALIAAFKNSIELSRIWTQHRDQRFLNESLGRTVFDKATIERATRNYIQPKCSNIDPAQEQEMRHALVATQEDLFTKVNQFLDKDQAHRHLLILADSGTGKTSFVLNYYAYNERRPVRKRHKLAIVPLGIRDADEILKGIPQPDETAMFLDALDEDTKAINNHRERIRELMASCSRLKRVVVTCRTQFFPKDEEIPVETGIARVGPRRAGEKGAYEFVKLYLSPFDDEDVKHYIWRRYPFWARRERQKAYDLALKIPLLSVRPMLLAHIPDIVASGVEIVHSHQLYEAMVDAWLERESSWVDKQALRKFSEHLAVDLYVNRAARGMERVPRGELGALAQAWSIPLDAWQIGGRSLLNRDAEGNYKFAHRSIMEYLFVLQLKHGDQRCTAAGLTDQMKEFLMEMLLGNSPLFAKIEQALLPLDWTAECMDAASAGGSATNGHLAFFLALFEIGALSRRDSVKAEDVLSFIEAQQRTDWEKQQQEKEQQLETQLWVSGIGLPVEMQWQGRTHLREVWEMWHEETRRQLLAAQQEAFWMEVAAKAMEENRRAAITPDRAKEETWQDIVEQSLKALSDVSRAGVQEEIGRRICQQLQTSWQRRWRENIKQSIGVLDQADCEKSQGPLGRLTEVQLQASWKKWQARVGQLIEAGLPASWEKRQTFTARQIEALLRESWAGRQGTDGRHTGGRPAASPEREISLHIEALDQAAWMSWQQRAGRFIEKQLLEDREIWLEARQQLFLSAGIPETFSFRAPSEGVLIVVRRRLDPTRYELQISLLGETAEDEIGGWVGSISQTRIDAFRSQKMFASDYEIFSGRDNARLWRLAHRLQSHGLGYTQMRNVVEKIQFEATDQESPQYTVRFVPDVVSDTII